MSAPKETAYDLLISPLMREIIRLCQEHQINMAAQFALDHDDDGYPLYCTTVLGDSDPADKSGRSQMVRLSQMMEQEPAVMAFTLYKTKGDA